MKARMKRLISIKSIPILALALLIVLGSALAAGRDPVSGSGSANATGPATFEGKTSLTIGGEAATPSFVATLQGPPEPSDEGVLHAKVSHTFDFGDGNTFTTDDKAVMEPIDEFGLHTLNESLTITGGTGDYDGACGELRVHGQIHLGEGWVSFDVHGAISR